MQCLISSNERAEVKRAFGESAISVALPFDFLLYTARGAVAAERKHVPGDLLSSVEDGRLARECAAMREAAEYRILIPEGEIHYGPDEHVKDGKRSLRWTREGVRNLLRSVKYVEGVEIEYSDSIEDTVRIVQGLQKWFDDPKHGSFRVRPGIQAEYFKPTTTERYLYWLQGLPSVSTGRAKNIAEVLRNPCEVLNASIEDWMQVPGIGRQLASRIYEFLH